MRQALLRSGFFFVILAVFAAGKPSLSPTAGASRGYVFNIRDYGAVGDGTTPATAALNQAIAACNEAGGGQVLVPPGRYLAGTLHLQSHVTLFLDAGAVLIGTTNLAQYQQPAIPSSMPEARWGKWHRALILGENVEDVAIAGQGMIDGNKVFDPTGEERMRGPHTIVLVNCRGFTLRDVSIVDSANYAVLFQVSDRVEIRNVKFTGGWDGVHFRGAPDRPCRDVNIIGCRFYTGDDSIAGRYWDNVVIRNANIEFVGAGKAEQAKQPVKGPGVDARPLPAWGLYARNVEQLTLEDVRLSFLHDDFRPVIFAEEVRQLNLDNVRFPEVDSVDQPIVTNNVGRLNLRNTKFRP